MKKTTILVSVLAVAGLFFATGCSKEDFGSRMFSKMDNNGDSFVDKKEYIEVSTKRFEKVDDNDDNKVTSKEAFENRFAKKMPEIAKSLFAKYDTNKDGVVEKSEMLQVSEKSFIKTDSNSDGKLTKDEMKVYRQNEMFDKMDVNSDNAISREEFQNFKSPFAK